MNEGLPFGTNENEKICALFYGKDSKVYFVFKEAILSLPYKKFCLFMSTLFLVCRLNQNYSQLCNDLNVKGKYMHPKIFDKIFKVVDSYGKDEEYGSRFWVKLEDAFNSIMHTVDSHNEIILLDAIEEG
jgi:hypothetical protein